MDNLDIRRVLAIIRQHLTLIILSTIACMVVAFGLAELVVTPQYTSTTQILVNQKQDNSDNTAAAYQAQQADVQMISTYKDIITNQVILKQVKADLANPTVVVTPAKKAVYGTDKYGDSYLKSAAKPAVTKSGGQSYKVSVAQLQKSIKISNQQNSQVFALAVKTDNANKSAAVANAIATEFKSRIKDIMSVNNVTIVSRASAGTKTSPSLKLYLLAGLLIGLILSVGYALLVELTNTTVRSSQFLDDIGLANLGQVNRIKNLKKFSANHDENAGSGSRSRARV